MEKRNVNNGQRTNRHGIPIGLKDIEEIVDEAERREKKPEYKRKAFFDSVRVEPDPNYRKKFKENVRAREEAEEIEAKKRLELLKLIEKMKNDEER